MPAQASKMPGFSLPELLVALILTLFMLIATTSLYIANQEASNSLDDITSLQEDIRFIHLVMQRSLEGDNGSQIKYVNSSSVSLQVNTDVLCNGSRNSGSRTVTYSLSDDELTCRDSVSGTVSLADRISRLRFLYANERVTGVTPVGAATDYVAGVPSASVVSVRTELEFDTDISNQQSLHFILTHRPPD